MEDGEVRDWSELTPVLLTVFRRLTLEDLWRGAMLACRSWLEASRDPLLFSSLDLEPSFAAAGGGSRVAAAWWTPWFVRRVDAMLRSAAAWGDGSLRELRVRHCSDRSLALVAESAPSNSDGYFRVQSRCPNLQILSIKSSQNATDDSMIKIALACPMLTELDISNCYEISFKSLEAIGQNCPKLSILKRNFLNWLDPSQNAGIVPDEYQNACPQDGDREASAIATFIPGLKHLELRFSKLSVRGLVSISESCSAIQTLDLFGCANLTGRAVDQASVKFKNLKTLVRPNFYVPRSVFHAERYGHWRLYDERFQTNVFQI